MLHRLVMTIICSVLINAPVSKVFGTFTDIEKSVDVIEDIKKVKITEKPKVGVGTRWFESRLTMGAVCDGELWVTQFEKDKVYEIGSAGQGYDYLFKYTFAPKDGGTELTLSYDQKAQNIIARSLSFISYLMKPSMKKLFLEEMNVYKAYIEKKSKK